MMSSNTRKSRLKLSNTHYTPFVSIVLKLFHYRIHLLDHSSEITRKMVFGDEWLLSPKPFISSPRLLRDKHDFVTLSLSLKLLWRTFSSPNYFIEQKKKKTYLWRTCFIIQYFRHQSFYLLTKYFITQYFYFLFYFSY